MTSNVQHGRPRCAIVARLAPLGFLLAPPAAAQDALALEHVTVVDVQDGRLVPDQTVVVTGNRIQAVGPAARTAVPRGARVVDATGKYLIPGLWDMHVHVGAHARRLYPRYVAHGVTGIREMAQRFPHGADSFRVWQREVAAGTLTGPRSVGPSADLTEIKGGLFQDNGALSTPIKVRRVVDSLKAAGDQFVKFHGTEAPENPKLYWTIARAARQAGLPLVGHTPMPEFGVTTEAVADSGQRSIEHFNNVYQCIGTSTNTLDAHFERYERDSVALDEACARAARAFRRNDTWVTPTVVIGLQGLRIEYDKDTSARREARMRAARVGIRRMIQTMYRAGIRNFLAGSDAGSGLPTGLSVVEEVRSLAHVGGLSPLEALQAATLNPAKFFRATDSLGTVAPGKLADVVLLDADPLADIDNVAKIRAVVADGRYFDRAALDALDPEGAKDAAGYTPVEPRP